MQTLHIILSLMGIVAYVATATFACYAFGRLKRQEIRGAVMVSLHHREGGK